MYIKKGDKVQVLSGKDRGKQGVILRALPAENKVVVEGVSVVKKAVKPNAANQQGGIVSQEAPIDASNVNLVCPECGKGTRVGHTPAGFATSLIDTINPPFRPQTPAPVFLRYRDGMRSCSI